MEYNYIFAAGFDNTKLVENLGGTIDGSISVHALMFNTKARYPDGPIHPYIGAGLGYSYFEIGDVTEREWGGPGVHHMDGVSGGGFCYQFMAGVDFDVAPNLSFGIGYKYFAALPTIGSETDELYSKLDYKAHMITLGLAFMF
jgi:opacity protein-like surface antigen